MELGAAEPQATCPLRLYICMAFGNTDDVETHVVAYSLGTGGQIASVAGRVWSDRVPRPRKISQANLQEDI